MRVPHPLVAGFTLAFAIPCLAIPALAQAPERETRLLVYGDDPCPQAEDEEEIVVCARRPEDERYRIPPRFRAQRDRPLEVSWTARAWELEDAQRFTRPNSCSVVGSDGQTGCTEAMIRQWAAERRAEASRSADIP
jgi:hypothetical protein